MISTSDLSTLFGVTPQSIFNNISRYSIDKDTAVVKKGKKNFFKSDAVRTIFEKKGFEYRKRVITLANVKGGVGKTTVAVSIAQKASDFGFKTLLVDCDKQGNATERVWPQSREEAFPCLYDVVSSGISLESCIKKASDFLHLVPSNLSNQLLDGKIVEKSINLGSFFEKQLEHLDYDLIIFDTEPNLSKINLTAMLYSDTVLAPVLLDRDSISGLELLSSFVEDQSSNWSMKAKVVALINSFDARMTTDAIAKLDSIKGIGVEALRTTIRVDQQFRKAQETSELPWASKANEDITLLTTELLSLKDFN